MNIYHHKKIPREVVVPDLSQEDVERITNTVFLPSEPRRADVLFVFGTSHGNWREAIECAKRGLVEKILINGHSSTGTSPSIPHAEVIRGEFVAADIPKEQILTQPTSTNTLEDVIFGKKVLDENGMSPKSVLFVSKSHHSGRAFRTLKKFFPHIPIHALTYDTSYEGVVVRKSDWEEHKISRERVYGEYLRILEYTKHGDIAEV